MFDCACKFGSDDTYTKHECVYIGNWVAPKREVTHRRHWFGASRMAICFDFFSRYYSSFSSSSSFCFVFFFVFFKLNVNWWFVAVVVVIIIKYGQIQIERNKTEKILNTHQFRSICKLLHRYVNERMTINFIMGVVFDRNLIYNRSINYNQLKSYTFVVNIKTILEIGQTRSKWMNNK